MVAGILSCKISHWLWCFGLAHSPGNYFNRRLRKLWKLHNSSEVDQEDRSVTGSPVEYLRPVSGQSKQCRENFIHKVRETSDWTCMSPWCFSEVAPVDLQATKGMHENHENRHSSPTESVVRLFMTGCSPVSRSGPWMVNIHCNLYRFLG